MMLPDFLIIGAQRAGTTWLDDILRTHPDIRMARNRKELHFFDQNYDKGPEWYGSFFTSENGGDAYRVGETTPHYLFRPEVPGRIAELIPECQLIAILRDPIARAYSQYGHNVKTKGWTRSFEEAIEEEPQILERGKYMQQLRRFISLFGEEKLLVCIFEEATEDPDSLVGAVGRFLGVAPEGFTTTKSARNASYVPRFPRAFATTRSMGRMLRRAGLDAVVESVKRAGLPAAFGSRGRLDPMSEETRQRLRAYFEEDTRELEDFLDRRIAAWR